MLFTWIFIYLLKTPTTCSIYGLLHTIAYIKFPTTKEYGTLHMHSISSYILGYISLVSFKWLAKGVLTSLTFCILNISNTFSMYSLRDNVNLFIFLSLVTLIPRICFATPKSFTTSELAHFLFNTFVYCMLDPATSMSSTFNNKII